VCFVLGVCVLALKVAHYGEPGSFSEEGARKCFEGERVKEYIPCGKMTRIVFDKVISGEADCGVVPVENSNAGIVNTTYDLLRDETVYVIREEILHIRQYLLANHGIGINQLKRVYSHPVAIQQCSRFLQEHRFQVIDGGDTASCANKVKNEKLDDAGAIGSRRSAEVYDLDVLASNIQNDENNFTRFFVISKETYKKRGNKTSIVFDLRNGLNSLYKCLGFFIRRNITIVKLESRPSRRPFDDTIYMDFLGYPHGVKEKDALHDLLFNCQNLKIIGNYMVAKLPISPNC